MVMSLPVAIHVVFGLVLIHGVHDHRPALHDRDRVHAHQHDPNEPYRGIHRSTNGMNTRPLQRRWPSPQSKQIQIL